MIKNFAHRGFKGKYPENTMLAFEKAVEAGAQGIEFDVQMSSDGHVVIIHDERLERTTDGSGFVGQHSLEELKELNASNQEKEEFGFNAILTLREYFEYVKDKDIISNVELKNSIINYPGMEEKVLELVEEFKLRDKVILSSFNHLSMVKVKELDENIKCGILAASWLVNPGHYCKSLGMEAYHPAAYSLDEETMEELREHGIEVNAWMGQIDFSLERLIELKVDAIISDHTDKLHELLDR